MKKGNTMIVNGQTHVENAQTSPTYSIVLYDEPSMDFVNQYAFFKDAVYAADRENPAATDADLEAANRAAPAAPAAPAAGAGAGAAENKNKDDENTKKRVTQKFKQDQLKKKKSELINAAGAIYIYGLQCRGEIQEKAFNAAIPGLSMILGTYRTFFDDANDEERGAFTKVLIERCSVDLGKGFLIGL